MTSKPTTVSERNKASRLRKRDAATLSEDQTKWLAEYTERTAGRAPNAGQTRAAPDPEPDTSPTVAPTGDPEPQSASPSPSPEPLAPSVTPTPPLAAPPPPPPPPPPPRVPPAPSSSSSAGGGPRATDWRAKYRGAEGQPREATCQLVAGHWVGALEAMAAAIRATGHTPIVEPALLRPSIVLAVDELLPDHLVLTPRVEALLGTTAVCIQRFALRDAIRASSSSAAGTTPSRPWPPPPDLRSVPHPDEPTPPVPPIPVSPLQTELALVVRDPDGDRPIV